MKLGAVYQSNSCGEFFVLSYFNCEKVLVKFLDTNSEVVTQSSNIRRGCVKDPLHPSVYGVGFIGVGRHKPSHNKLNSKIYSVWRAMLGRCYSEKVQKIHPTYKGCTVCTEWHNFQNFADWFELNSVDGLHIDKDTLVDGNKIYSPEFCLFITAKKNNIKARAKNYLMRSPCGDVVMIYNMREFCKKNNLSNSSMSMVVNNKRKQHKGWKLEV